MKAIKLILICGVLVWFSALGYGAYRVYLSFDISDPLRLSRIGLKAAQLEKETEEAKQETLRQQAETAKTLARIERQRQLESSQAVSSAAVALAVFWRSLPLLLFASSAVGGLVYAFTRRTQIETPFVKAMLPVRKASAIVEKSLQVSSAAEMAKALSFQETVSRERLADGINLFKALRPGRENISINQSALPASTEQHQAGNMPTFAEIFDSREIHGDLILGFDEETPRLGKYEAVHSCLIYGLARSGKTSWLRGLIGQTILTEPETRCDVLDPHAARADSLLGSLPKTKHFHAIDAKDPIPALTAFGDELRRRLLSEEATFPPRILLIDELNQLASEPYKPQLAALCEATAQRGRKVNMFLLATAQDVREKKIGDFRASLSSAYFFKGKSAQVKAFLDDPEAAKLYRKHVTRHGVALFAAADEEPKLMLIPECKPNDLQKVERTLKKHSSNLQAGRGEEITADLKKDTREMFDGSEAKIDSVSNVIPFPKRDTTTQADTEQTQTDTDDDTGDTALFDAVLELCRNDKKTLSDRSGVSVSLIKEIQAGRRRITADTRHKFECVLHGIQTQEA